MEGVTSGEHVEIEGLRAYTARPAKRTGQEHCGAATLLLPMITGIGARVRELAHLTAADTGAPALVWDPWHGVSSDDTSSEELYELFMQLSDEDVVQEQQALLGWLAAELGAERIGVIGWCLGGRLAMTLAARDPRICAVVAYHPTLLTVPPPAQTTDALDAVARIDVPVMVHYPGRDHLVPRETFERLQSALQHRATASATVTHVYPDAEHGFSDTARHAHGANADAWAQSWPHTASFLRARW